MVNGDAPDTALRRNAVAARSVLTARAPVRRGRAR